MPYLDPKEGRSRIRARNVAFVAKINARTVCAHCGAQPVEWHNPEHVELGRKLFRIGHLVGGASLKSIETEMARCTPLCRRCHMREDGRMRGFMVQATRAKTQPPKPCRECGELAKPLRRGFCARCDDRRRRAAMTPEQRQQQIASQRRRYYTKTPEGENLGAVQARESQRRRREAAS